MKFRYVIGLALAALCVAAVSPLTAAGTTPAPNFTFEGVGDTFGGAPPDPTGDVGPNHYVQAVNAVAVGVFSKTGTPLAAPFSLADLFPAPCSTSQNVDPQVAYDREADRWVLLSVARDQHFICFAVSKSADPLGAYFTYAFETAGFPDAPKLGIWRNTYAVSAFSADGGPGPSVYAFDRKTMLKGKPSTTFVKFEGSSSNQLLPADVDGPTPPKNASPALFYGTNDDTDSIELYALNANFATPAASTFSVVAAIPVAPFTGAVCADNFECIHQPGTTQLLDAQPGAPQRFVYRRFGNREVLIGNFTVGGGTGEVGAALRWFELRNTGAGWTLFQEGTHDPGDGHDRWTGSIAMDRRGDIALGYSVSSSTLFPSIRYATRTPTDPPGTLHAEATLQAGSGSQEGFSRWGDYSSMTVDPTDDCTFWYTNE